VLAAGMIKLTGWDGKSDFYDPLCGSGTLLIEAAMQAMNIPAGYYRDKFGFMYWPDYDERLWREIKKKAAALKQQPSCRFYGSDISERAITASRLNIRTAGLASAIRLKLQDVRESSPQGNHGIIITNPPYGERMKTEDLNGFYKELGDTLKKNYTGFSAWLLTSDREALKHVGLRTSKKIILFNGPLECRFANFGLYKGSRK
jgi:putative N6-adenine-specific DNA methylase